MTGGFVYLVGAGPGDPRLLTLRAFELLRSAEVVAHDELVAAEILALAPGDAELLNVGHRGGHGEIIPALHSFVLERARAGKKVVRLKCGDPMVFGRAAEEAEELRQAGIPFEIVPGISAALGAAAYGGIPLTDRRYASRVTFATGHAAAGQQAHARETLVLYMAAGRLEENLENLINSGWAPETPAAYISSATTTRQQIAAGTISDLPLHAAKIRDMSPALVIVGKVMCLRQSIEWLRAHPLAGKQVLVARARPGRSRIASELRAAGASVQEAPRVFVADFPFLAPIAAALSDQSRCEGLVFGCAASVEVAMRHGLLKGCESPIFAAGDEAASALDRHGIEPQIVFAGACAEAINAHQLLITNKRLILLTSDRGRPSLVAELTAAAALVESVAIYSYQETFPDLALLPDAVILPSSSAAHLLLEGPYAAALRDLPAIAIGTRTQVAAERLGVSKVIQTPHDSIESVITSVLGLFDADAPSNLAHVRESIGRTQAQ
jgi:uroporphyrinogen III methyltransferase / synthase